MKACARGKGEEFPTSRGIKETVSPICQARPSLSEPAHASRSRGRLFARFGAKKKTRGRVERPSLPVKNRTLYTRAHVGV